MAELKLAEQKIWWGPMAEQKMVGALGWLAGGTLVQVQKGQAIGGDGRGGTPSASAKRSAEQKMAELKLAKKNKKWWNLVGILGHWVAGTPSASAKGQWNKKWWN